MTRYPKGNKGAKWTIKELDAVPVEWAGDTLSDGSGLTGTVRVFSGNVSIKFRFSFKLVGRIAWFYCGTYPTTDMASIRKERDAARNLVKSGVDPRSDKIASKIEAQAIVDSKIKADEQKRAEALNVNELFRIWIRDGVARSDGNKYLEQSFAKYTSPAIGKIEARELNEHHLRTLYRDVIAKGKTSTAVKLSTDIRQMLRWAEKRKPWRVLLVDGNPAELVDINKLIPPDYDPIRTRQLSVDEICELKKTFDKMCVDYSFSPNKSSSDKPLKQEVQIALWLCLGTICRIGELLKAKWNNINLVDRTWFIPAADTKDNAGNQLIYLSDFTLAQFQQLYKITGQGEYAFPSRLKEGHVCLKSVSKQVGDRQVKFKSHTRKLKHRVANNMLVLGESEWTPHDLRRTGATLMQKLKISRDVINLCQNHVIGSKIDRSYLLDDYADDKRDAWYKLGERIESILNETK